MQFNREWLRVVGDRVLQLGRPGRGLDGLHIVGLVKNELVIKLLWVGRTMRASKGRRRASEAMAARKE